MKEKTLLKGTSLIMILIFLMLTTFSAKTYSSVDRNTIVANAKSCVGDHYVFGGHGNKYKNDYGKDEGIFWYDDGTLKLWKFETTKKVWDKYKDSGYLERTGSGTPNDPYRYWDKCQGYGGGTRTSCDSATQKRHFDCVGLVYWVYKQSGYSWSTEPWTVENLQSIDTDIPLNKLQPGDLVYKGSSHVGIYIGFSGVDSVAEVIEAKGHDWGVIKSVYDDSWTSAGSLLGGVGGYVIPVDKIGLLAPYIGLASTTVIALTATIIYVKRFKHKKRKQ